MNEKRLKEAAENAYNAWMGGTMNDVREAMNELGEVLEKQGTPTKLSEEEQDEQEPAWSEEDEWKFSDILALLRGGENYHYNTPELFAWLKSIKDRVQPQPKQEWSEEDEVMMNGVLNHLREYFVEKKGYPYVADEDSEEMKEMRWLKSLKPQSHWKPTEEQMEALYDSIPQNVMEISKREMLLDSLYIDLRKL